LRTGNDHSLVAPYGLFEAADGQVAIAPSNDQFYLQTHRRARAFRAAHASGIPDQSRSLRAPCPINAIINAEIGKQPIAHWLDVLKTRPACRCGRVMG